MDPYPDISESVGYLVTGFTVVMGTLLSLAFVCSLVGFLFKKFPALAGKPEAVEENMPKRKTLSASAVDSALLSVIGAAVDQSLGGRYRIKTVTPLGKK